MKKLLLFALIFVSGNVMAQKYFTKTGTTEFKASVEAFEPVEAKNASTTAILNTANGEVAVLLFMKSFHFDIALMEEHFNENYMDSDKFPKSTFKGKLEGFDFSKLGKDETELPVSGTLTIRGKSQSVKSTAKLKLVDGKVMVHATLTVKPEDYGIEIPSVVREKIAKSINIIMDYELVKKG